MRRFIRFMCRFVMVVALLSFAGAVASIGLGDAAAMLTCAAFLACALFVYSCLVKAWHAEDA